jgi:tetratricopeptide (TPR) repeat protein
MMNNQARVAMNQAMAAFQSSNFPEAEKNLLASLDSNPSNPDTLYYLGVAYVSQKKWDEAKEVLQKAAIITNALVSLVMKDAKGVVQPSPYVAVQNLINNLLPNLPALKLRVEGNDEMANKNFKGAVAKFEESLKLTPDDPDTYYNMALAYGYDKQWEAATKAVEKAVALRPEEQAYLSLKKTLASNATIEKAKEIADQGDAAYKSKDFATALKKYEEALGMLPDPVMQASVWAQIGRANTMMKQSEAAIIAYQKAIDLAPQNPDHKKALSQHFTIVGQQQLTDKQYDEAFSSFAQAGISVYQLGQEWAKKKETDLAIMAFERVLKTDPQNVAAYFELGTLYYFDKKDNAKAKENLSKYLQAGKDEKLLEQSRNIMAVIDRKK